MINTRKKAFFLRRLILRRPARSASCSMVALTAGDLLLGAKGTRATLLGCLLATSASMPAARAVSGFTGAFTPAAWSSQANYGGSNYSPMSSCDNWGTDPTIYACVSIETTTAYLRAKSYPGSDLTSPADTVTTATASWNNTSSSDYFVALNAALTWQMAEQTGKTATAEINTYETAHPENSSVVASLSSGSPNATVSMSNPIRVLPQWSLGIKVMVPITETANPDQNVSLTVSQFNAVPAPLPAAGAVSVFTLSRRLRRRCRMEGKHAGRPSSPRRTAATYLSSALHLSDEALGHIPMSFDYATRAAASSGTTHRM
jgi:hypothetical protein